MQPGEQRLKMDATLRAAFAESLLSPATFADRIDRLLTAGTLEPDRLIGDLTLRQHGPVRRTLSQATRRRWHHLRHFSQLRAAPLLALDWTGATSSLLIGRADECDVRLADMRVSRWHARLSFRDDAWVVQDLRSRNGTRLNGDTVGRARLIAGDVVSFADMSFRID